MKISRLIEILLTLLSREKVSASEFARRFGVSKKTIYRDAESLQFAGIPVELHLGRYGGLALPLDYKLDKRLLTTQDLQHILLALSNLTQQISDEEILKTLDKISGMVNDDFRQIFIDLKGMRGADEMQQKVRELASAIRDYRLVKFDYIDAKGNEMRREIEPTTIFLKVESWYIRGFDRLRQDFRTFKLSRMLNLCITGLHFSSRESSIEPLVEHFRAVNDLYEVTISFDKIVRERIVELWGEGNIVRLDEKYFAINLKLPLEERVFQHILSLGSRAKVESDTEFQRGFEAYLKNLQKFYRL